MKKVCFTWLVGVSVLLLAAEGVFAQTELKNVDRVVYEGIGYTKLGFGEVNRQLLTEKQTQKLSHRIQRIQADYGAVIVFASLIAEEVRDWENDGLQGLPRHYLGEDPRAERNHVVILFSEAEGKNWIRYGSDNEPYFTSHTQRLTQLFRSTYRNPKAYRPIKNQLKAINRIYSRLAPEQKKALLHPRLSAGEWVDLARAEMDIARDYDSAAEHLHNALRLDSAYAEAYLLLGYAYLELQQWEPAANALAASWSLEASFDTALGRLTLHYLQNEYAEAEEWAERLRQFSPDFEEKIYEVTHYANKGSFIGNAARGVFNKLFQKEIQKSNLNEKDTL